MANIKDVKRVSKRSGKKQRVRKQSRQSKPTSKSTTRPSDVYEAEEKDPQEELKAGQRYDVRNALPLQIQVGLLPDVAEVLVAVCSVWTIMSTSFHQTLKMRK